MWKIKREDFITQDEIDHNLGRGSGYSHGSFRIYDYFQEKHDSKEAAEFLKKNMALEAALMHLPEQTIAGKTTTLKGLN